MKIKKKIGKNKNNNKETACMSYNLQRYGSRRTRKTKFKINKLNLFILKFFFINGAKRIDIGKNQKSLKSLSP